MHLGRFDTSIIYLHLTRTICRDSTMGKSSDLKKKNLFVMRTLQVQVVVNIFVAAANAVWT